MMTSGSSITVRWSVKPGDLRCWPSGAAFLILEHDGCDVVILDSDGLQYVIDGREVEEWSEALDEAG